jgi:CheY-like chemotaxis protein
MGYAKVICGLTGNALADDVSTFMRAGANLVIPKPLRPNQLEALLAYTRMHGVSAESDTHLSLHKKGADEYFVRRMTVSEFQKINGDH